MNVNTEFDSQFDKISDLTWFPWVGKDYISKSEHRLLIIAESHYNIGEHVEEQNIKVSNRKWLTRDIVQRYPINHQGNDTNPMFENLHRCLFSTNNIDRENLWNHIAFYNFIQRPMNYNYKERPNNEDFQKGWNVFFEVIRILKPTDIIFVGVSAADRFYDYAKSKNMFDYKVNWVKVQHTNRYARIIHCKDLDANPVVCYAIQHTSHHFSWKAWHEFLKVQTPKILNNLSKYASSNEDYTYDADYINLQNAKLPPFHLKHKPIYSCDYKLLYPNSDVHFITVGKAQWDNRNSLSVKCFREDKNGNISRMSEEIPATRLAEMAIVLLSSIKATQDSINGKEIKSSYLHEKFVTEESEFVEQQLQKESESLRKTLHEIRRLIREIDIDNI